MIQGSMVNVHHSNVHMIHSFYDDIFYKNFESGSPQNIYQRQLRVVYTPISNVAHTMDDLIRNNIRHYMFIIFCIIYSFNKFYSEHLKTYVVLYVLLNEIYIVFLGQLSSIEEYIDDFRIYNLRILETLDDLRLSIYINMKNVINVIPFKEIPFFTEICKIIFGKNSPDPDFLMELKKRLVHESTVPDISSLQEIWNRDFTDKERVYHDGFFRSQYYFISYLKTTPNYFWFFYDEEVYSLIIETQIKDDDEFGSTTTFYRNLGKGIPLIIQKKKPKIKSFFDSFSESMEQSGSEGFEMELDEEKERKEILENITTLFLQRGWPEDIYSTINFFSFCYREKEVNS